MHLICIALGGALGSVSRFYLGEVLTRHDSFPLGTLIANIVGSLLIGIAAGFWEIDQRKTPQALFMMTGFCGGFTTFSTFSLQTLELIQRNDLPRAGLNITASFTLCLLCTWLGWIMGQSLKKA